ncbi:GspE/PulE family protein [Sphingomonas sp.]|uniref:GspE/PulE family protein n=1 Tax=Sphingomonas sp. TaxID=28214 RepID=UPI003B00E7F0
MNAAGHGLRARAATVRGIVADAGLVAPEALARVDRVAGETGERFDAVLTRLGLLSENRLLTLVADHTGLSVADPERLAAAPATSLSAAFLRDARALPLDVEGEVAEVAFADPLDPFAGDAISFALGRPVTPCLARASDIEAAIDRLHGAAAGRAGSEAIADEADLERIADLSSDAPAIRAVNRLIAAAVEQRASDIHVEPTDDRVSVRFRIDGVLAEQEALPVQMRNALVSRIKIMAGLNIAEKRLPQDGRMRAAVRGQEIDLRVATAPSIQGESVVLRILDRASLPLDFASLGFDEGIAQRFLPVIHRPHGIVLVTGPTGSGKTTTLYAALAELNSAAAKLLTIEDPIEYRLPGVVQTQAAPAIGLDFAAALRSFLRQDPDVIMVGEIRDGETAQVAVQAALTGHTILSTLHTISASAAITRLIDMGTEPFLINSTLNAVLAQRLARRLCGECAEPWAPPPSALAAFGRHGMAYAEGAFRRPVGCPACKRTGYRGRIALLELLVMDECVAALVLARAEAREIERAATAAGMRLLVEDGLAKAAAGLTSLDEVLRVVSADTA